MHSNDHLVHQPRAAHTRFGQLGRRALLGAALVAVPACDSPADGDGRLALRDLDLCKYDDFSVDITSGPSKGLHLEGTVYFIQKRPELHIGGMLQTLDGEIIPISAAVTEQSDLSLTFHTPGGFVQGLGRMEGELCGADDIAGAAIGPVIAGGSDISKSDSGHWLMLKPSLLTDFPAGPFNFPGDLVNQGGDEFTTNVTASECFASGGVVELRCGPLCLYTYEACRGGDHNDEVIINGTQS